MPKSKEQKRKEAFLRMRPAYFYKLDRLIHIGTNHHDISNYARDTWVSLDIIWEMRSLISDLCRLANESKCTFAGGDEEFANQSSYTNPHVIADGLIESKEKFVAFVAEVKKNKDIFNHG